MADLTADIVEDVTDTHVTDHEALHARHNLQDHIAPARFGLIIVETATGVWSGDAPARTDGDFPILFVGLSATSDPADGTNGIDTPANVNDSDVVVRPSA